MPPPVFLGPEQFPNLTKARIVPTVLGLNVQLLCHHHTENVQWDFYGPYLLNLMMNIDVLKTSNGSILTITQYNSNNEGKYMCYYVKQRTFFLVQLILDSKYRVNRCFKIFNVQINV